MAGAEPATPSAHPYLASAYRSTVATVNGNRTGVSPNAIRPASSPAALIAAVTASASSAGQCTITSSCWKNTSSARIPASARRNAASISSAQSAALPWTTKFRVKRPRARAFPEA